jgi:hypothetical protein
MVWAAIGMNYKSPLIMINGTLDAPAYVEMLKRDFFEHAYREHRFRPWVLVQDGATAHTAAAGLDELTKYFILCPAWPANSPDINPTEQLWGLMKNRLRWNGIRPREAAIAELLEVWEQIPMDVINKLCE